MTMLGGYISDLEKGDVFKPVEYVITPFMCSEYAHGTEQTSEYFHSARNPAGRQIRPPTMIHVDKMRILEENCTKEKRIAGMAGPDARVHYEYHARHHSPAYVGEKVVVTTPSVAASISGTISRSGRPTGAWSRPTTT
jgi:hypothetical protein